MGSILSDIHVKQQIIFLYFFRLWKTNRRRGCSIWRIWYASQCDHVLINHKRQRYASQCDYVLINHKRQRYASQCDNVLINHKQQNRSKHQLGVHYFILGFIITYRCKTVYELKKEQKNTINHKILNGLTKQKSVEYG